MLVYGRNVALEYLNSNKKIRKIYIQENFHDEKILNLIEKRHFQTKVIPKFELDKMVNGVNQGIVLEIEDFSYTDYHEFIEKEDSFVVILDHLEDPHNLGAIIRTCEAAGVSGIIIPKDRSVCVNATVIKTSAGTCDNIPISMVTNLNQVIKELKNNNFWIVGTDINNSSDYHKIDYSGKIALIIGNEGKGISKLIKDSCDFMAYIPMYGKVNSLNASVAAGIMIYEIVGQKNKNI